MPRSKQSQVTFRLSVDDPTEAKLDVVLARLTEAGFEVTQEGRRGFSVSGARTLAESVFDSPIEFEAGEPRFTSDPKTDMIPKSVQYRVFFPTKPTFY